MANYCERSDVERLFGRSNIERWADLDGKRDSEDIKSTIDRQLQDATAYLNSRLVDGPYTIPFTSPYPFIIIRITALLTGCFLYDGRQSVAEEKDMCKNHRTEANSLIVKIINGKLRLLDPTTNTQLETTSYTAPFVVNDGEEPIKSDEL